VSGGHLQICGMATIALVALQCETNCLYFVSDVLSMALTNPQDSALPVWEAVDGSPISCTEKIKVLNENFRELQQVVLDALEDGVLMGCSESHLRAALHEMIDALQLNFTA